MPIEERKEPGKQLPTIKETLTSLRGDNDFCKQSVQIITVWAQTKSPQVQGQIAELASGYKHDQFQAGINTLRDMMLAGWMIQAARHEKSQPKVAKPEEHHNESISLARKIAQRAKERLKPQSDEERYLERAQEKVNEINALESQFKSLTNKELRAKTQEFKTRFANGVKELAPTLQEEINTLRLQLTNETNGQKLNILRQQLDEKEKKMLQAEKKILDEILPEAFAAVHEASVRKTGLRHFDCQLIGGIALHDGKIAEMKTGEGKTLVATLPLYLNALAEHGAHLVTPNDYLSKVGIQWMGPIYEALGMSVGLIEHEASYVFDSTEKTTDEKLLKLKKTNRKEALMADITYGTNSEFGFDYLRDNMVQDLNQCVQREHYFAIVDEVDNILIDEARTPLIISGPGEEAGNLYLQCTDVVRQLKASTNSDNEKEEPNEDFVVDQKTKNTTLTEAGIKKVESILGIEDLYDENGTHSNLIPYLDNTLRANTVFKKDKDYVVKNGEIIIIDEFTGRLMQGRRYSEGLHQALEAKEGLTVQRESVTHATITIQNYFRKYQRLAGMTGTGKTDEEEFQKIYNMDVVEIPPNKPVIRIDEPDLVFKDEANKLQAVLEEIKDCVKKGRPVLIGTPGVDDSQKLHEILEKAGIRHSVLNAKEDEKEGLRIAEAGRVGAVTVATNMAGRGVDILLGGNPELLARENLKNRGVDLSTVSEEILQKEIAETTKKCQEEKEKVIALGGLHIMGTARHEARRIDNQLRGRAGRQGDPGSSRFYLSTEDDLMRRFGGDLIGKLMGRFKITDKPIESELIDWSFKQAQQKVEGYNFDTRQYILQFDDVINIQRETYYKDRRKILETENIVPILGNLLGQTVKSTLKNAFAKNIKREGKIVTGFNVQDFWQQIWEQYQLIIPPQIIEPLAREWNKILSEIKPANIESQIKKRLPEIESELSAALVGILALNENFWSQSPGWSKENFQQMLKSSLLRITGTNWTNHMIDIGEMQEGIGLRAYGQKNPVHEYIKESEKMFIKLNERNVKEAVQMISETLFRAQQAISQHMTFEEATRKKGEQKKELKEVLTA